MIAAILIGVVAGILSGMLGVGGGILFVPALSLLLGLDQVGAEATSLLAMIPVAAVGSWRHHRYGNLRVADAAWVGVLSLGGVVAGVASANAIPAQVLRLGFAVVAVNVAVQLIRRSIKIRRNGERSLGPVAAGGVAPGGVPHGSGSHAQS